MKGMTMRLLIVSATCAALSAGAAFAVSCEGGVCRSSWERLRDNDIDNMRLAMANGEGQPRYNGGGRPALREGRSEAFFIRGGYSFAASGQGLANGAGANSYSVGYQTKIRDGLPLKFEAELVYQKDKDPVIIGLGQEEATRRAITALASLRYDAPRFGPVQPYFSGGFGPVHVKTQIDDGVTPISDSKIELGYGARLGVMFPLSDRFSVDAGYRLLGATNDDIKTHTAEIGLAWRF
jgi:opacity protein-like surface antigen